MSLKKDYVRTKCGKLYGGHGEWHCGCCNPYRCSVRRMKPLARRRIRRSEKLTLKGQNDD